MATRQKRISAQDRRQQILQVAMRLFARRGFQGTTTRQIAERAGVNEALLFRHFSSKESLYWAAIDSKCRESGKRESLVQALRMNDGSAKVFEMIAEGILRRNLEDSTLSRLLLFSALENHRLSHRFFRLFVSANYEVLASYIRRLIREGKFRRMDPVLAARGFLGMIIYHFLIQELFGGSRVRKFDPKYVSRVLTQIWLEGMEIRRKRDRACGVGLKRHRRR